MTSTAGIRGSGVLRYAPWLILGLMVLWFTHEMVWSGKVPFYRDLGPYFYPMRFTLAESFKAGALPLWDRHVGMGFPLLADFQSGAFYPPHLLYLFFPFFVAVAASFLFHYLIAALGAYLLCRRWGFPAGLALTGTALFTFGGTIVSLSNLMNHFQTAVWLPLAVFLWEGVLVSRSRRDFVLLAFVLLVQFLAGSPEIYVMSLALLFLDGLRLRGEGAGISHRRLFFLFLGTNALVAGLAMVQILPTAELFMESRAKHIITYEKGIYWSLYPLSLINFFFPDREVALSATSGLRLFLAPEIPLLISLYAGAIALPGICLWLCNSSWKGRGILLGLVCLTLILAVGRHTPVYQALFQHVPLFGLIRFPEKFFFLTHALLLWMILRGLFLFFQTDGPPSRSSLIVVGAASFLLFFTYLFFRLDIEPLGRLLSRALHAPLLAPSTLESASSLLVHLERQVALTFGILALMLLWNRRKVQTGLCQALLLLLVFIDLSSAHRPYQYLVNPEFVYKSPRILPAPDAQPERLFYYPGRSDLHPSYYFISKRPSFAELNTLVFSNLLPNTGVFHGYDYMQELDALERWSYVRLLDFAGKLSPERQYRLLGALNVRYVSSFQPLPRAGLTLVRRFPEYPSWLYRLNRTVPRVYIVAKVSGEKDPLKIMDRLSRAAFDPLKEVMLEEALPTAAVEGFRSHAEITGYENQEVSIDASLNGVGVLVLADSFYPGWRVFVDGQEREVLRANYFFRAVVLPPGRHEVVFRYRPASLYYGLSVSLATLMLLLLFVVRGWRGPSVSPALSDHPHVREEIV